MTDLDLLALGAAVTFITVSGVYTYLRSRFTAPARVRARLARERRERRMEGASVHTGNGR